MSTWHDNCPNGEEIEIKECYDTCRYEIRCQIRDIFIEENAKNLKRNNERLVDINYLARGNEPRRNNRY